MKILWVLLMALWMVLSAKSHAAQTAQARLVCVSLRFHQGSAGFGSTLDLSSIGGSPNGELFPGGSDYVSGILLNAFGSPVTGSMTVALPPFTDANGNGFDDFFEVSQAVGFSTTAGDYTTFVSDGTISAQWSRGAGSPNGTCVLSLDDDSFGTLGDFVHTFEVVEYTGPLTYTPGNSNVVANVNLTQTGNSANTLQGPALFAKILPANFDELVLRAGNWTNTAAQTLSFLEHDLFRDTFLGTNYYGFVEFTDGDPNTGGYDYPFWQLSIDDLNDTDHDGIPDFSDDPAAVIPPRRPLLSLARGETNLLLTVSGDVGRLHHILESTNLVAGNWQTNRSLTLTNDPQTVSLPLPTVSKFWRALAQ